MARMISLAAGVLPEFLPEVVVDSAIAARFPAVGLRIDGQQWPDERVHALRSKIESARLTLLDVEVVWIRPGPADESLLKLVSIAARLGAQNLLVVSSDPNHEATAAKLGAICNHAAESGLSVSLEFGHFSAVQSLDQAASIVARANCTNAYVLVDPLHLSRNGASPSDVAHHARGLFRYAQFCDADADAPDSADLVAIREEALDGRLLLGEGILPLTELLMALPANLPLSIELRSKALREKWPDPADRARFLREQTETWLHSNDPEQTLAAR